MDHDDAGVLGESLLDWLASFDQGEIVPTWRDLSDGRKLWAVLKEVDDEYFTGTLPEPDITPDDDWTRRWQNLKHLQKQVSMYYRDVCNGQEQVTVQPDLQAIATDYSVGDLEKLIMGIIRTAMASPQSNQRMAQRLMSLGRERAMIIAGELRAMEEMDEYEQDIDAQPDEELAFEQDGSKHAYTNGTSSPSKGAMFHDPLLEREEELLQSKAVIDKLKANYDAAQKQLADLRLDKEKLEEAFAAFREDMEGRGKKVMGDDAVRKLQQQADYDRSYIDDLESQLQTCRVAAETYEKQIAQHKQDAMVAQQLRDDLQLLRSENEDLNQKTKANDNLKKKIQALQEQERAASAMRDELKQASERLQEMDKLKSLQAALEKEIIEKQGLIRNQEYQINELTTTRKHAEYDSRVLAQKLEQARERHEHDHEALEELRRKLGEGNSLPDDLVSNTQAELDEQLKAKSAQATTPAPKNDEVKNLNEKLALLEQQLQAADARLKQASQRNIEYEDRERKEASEQEKAAHHIEDLEARTVELRKQLDHMSKQPKDASSPDIAVLQRENRLMASAWYDLSNRLHNNGAALGRRKHEPKSWIGKQRALVGPYNALPR